MILAVDDQQEVLALIKLSLKGSGYQLVTTTDPAEALSFLTGAEPELIISDVMMPEMDGMQFRAAYLERFPRRTTPFIFLSAQGDPETIVRGLASGADDFLTKPIHPEVLKAKVTTILARSKRPVAPAFHGDIGRFPLVKIMQFCETKGLTGTVEIPVGRQIARLRFIGGQIDLGSSPGESEILDQLYDLEEGTFSIYPEQIDFSPLADAALTPATPAAVADIDKPMGKLSGVKINQRLIQIQTEFVTYPEQQILSVVILDGKVLHKRSTPAAATAKEELARLIEEQHVAVEQEVRTKAADLGKSKQNEEESPKEKFGRLQESGFEHYRKAAYAEALADWEEAFKIDPANKTLATNLAIVRKKLGN